MLIVRERLADRVHHQVAAAHDGVGKVPIAQLTNRTFRRRSDLFCADLFHPNREGHRVWADAAYPVLEEVLEQVWSSSTTLSPNAAI